MLRLIAFGMCLMILCQSSQAHVIQKRHDIIESSASMDSLAPIANETALIPENEAPVLAEGDGEPDQIVTDIMKNDENNNVNVPEPKGDNGIDESFTGPANSTQPEVIATNSQSNFTKEINHQDDSIENRLPSTSNEKPTAPPSSKIPSKDVNETRASTPAMVSSAEKPKRIDVSFARSTERAVPEPDTSTVPVSHSTTSMLSAIAITPRISVSETIRPRITSISTDTITEKRAKYLSETHASSSPASPDASWSDLKTVGEVNHNNVTLGKSLTPEEPNKAVNGKLDSEEITAESSSSTEKSAEDHETQLQKSNSSKIVDLPEDNSLSSLQSSSTKPMVIENNAKIEKPDEITTTTMGRVKNEKSEEITTTTTMGRMKNEEVTEIMTEKDELTTTEAEFTTVDDKETMMPEEMTTLPVKTKENLVIETTTLDTEIPTTIYVTTLKPEVVPKISSVKPEITTVKIETTPSVTTEIESTTQEVTKPQTIPTKPIVTKTTPKVNEAIFSSTTVRQVTKEKEEPHPITIEPVVRKAPESRTKSPEHQTEIAQAPGGERTDVNAMIAIGISVVAVVTLILLVGFLVVMRKRQKQLTYGQRCRPIGLDAYSLDNISVYNSVRRKSAIRASKRAFGNVGFDDPGLKNNPLSISQLAVFSQKRVTINDEFKDVPTVTARIEEVPVGCEDKNRYANVVPLPESRVHLKQLDDDEKTEYINANFVKGPKDTTHYYIACQAPLEHTIVDFWRMIWEQNSRVIIMATDLTENGIEKCAEYLPSSFVIDNHVTFGDYQIILKNREVRDKYAVSTVHLKNACTKTWREITHFWYQWPENGVPTDEASVIAMLLEARSYLKMVTPEQSCENGQQESEVDAKGANGLADKTKSLQRIQGPLTVHCSPGTGRTGTIVACDIAIRSLEQPMRNVDVPQIVYFVRRGRASAVQTREQYEFIYKVSHVYATKLTGPANDN